MDAEHIVVGSGLAALGTALGLRNRGRVIVLAGDSNPVTSYYDSRSTVPCAQLSAGGLGNDWHGVIPVSQTEPSLGAEREDFCELFEHFYPRADIRQYLGQSFIFVPWRPIRPWRELRRLAAVDPYNLKLSGATALALNLSEHSVSVSTNRGSFRANRVWLAAGALHTPKLLAASFGESSMRRRICDHATFYVGQVKGIAPPRVVHKRDGIYFQTWRPMGGDALFTLRPARFRFRELDFGIEQRAVFGMPTGGAVAKIMKRMSPGLLSEALFNRFGLFSRSEVYSVYAQVRAADAYEWSSGATPITVDPAVIELAARNARELQPFDGLRPSRRMDIYIPGIHLHNSVDMDELARVGVGTRGSSVQVVDPSAVPDIGAEHHSFKVLVAACLAARDSDSPQSASITTPLVA